MRYRNKTKSIRIVLRLIVGVTTSLFVLSFTNALDAESFTSHKGRFWNAEPVEECGRVLENGRFELIQDLDCSGEDPAITIIGPAKLNLNGYTISGNDPDTESEFKNVCILIEGARARVWNGTITNCADGVVIAGTGRHQVFRIISMGNDETGFKVDEDSNGNWLTENEAIGNLKENFFIEENSDRNHLIKNKAEDGEDRGYEVRGSYNHLYKNKAYGNSDDALRIRFGNNNKVIYNIFSGNESGEGVEIRSEKNFVRNNIIKQNETGIRIRENDNKVKKNIIINNVKEGIRVGSSNNKISSNMVLNNGEEGIRVEEGEEENDIFYNFVLGNEPDLKDENGNCDSNWWYKNFAKTGEPLCTLER